MTYPLLTHFTRYLSVLILLMSAFASAEGSFQVGLNQYLYEYDMTGPLLSSDTHPLYVRVNSASEVVNISICSRDLSAARNQYAQDNPNRTVTSNQIMRYEIRSENGATLIASGSGAPQANLCTNNFQTGTLNPPSNFRWSPADNGRGAGTYQIRLFDDSTLTYTGPNTPNPTTIDAGTNKFGRFDITVTNNRTTNPNPRNARGRLFAYNWAYNATNYTANEATDANYYVLVPGGRPGSNFVWQLDLQNFAGFVYDIVANPSGVDAENVLYSVPRTFGSGGGATINSVTEFFPIYLGYPSDAGGEPANPPQITNAKFTDSQGVDQTISPGGTTGVQDSGTFSFDSDVTGTHLIILDINKDGIFGSSVGDVDDVYLFGLTRLGTNEVVWDGTNNQGDPVPSGSYNAKLQVRMGEYHFVAGDAETSGGGANNGLTIYRALSNSNLQPTTVFWDDITGFNPDNGFNSAKPGNGGSTLPNGKRSVVGQSSGDFRHTWGNFDGGGFGNQVFVDTYVYGLASEIIVPAIVNDASDDPVNLGLAKNATVNSNQVTLDFYLENFSGNTLSSLSLTDNLDAVFGAGTYVVSSPPTLINSGTNSTINVNPNFNGSTDQALLAAESTLAASETAQVQVGVTVNTLSDQGNGVGVYRNSVTASAQLQNVDGDFVSVSDTSTNGADPDVDSTESDGATADGGAGANDNNANPLDNSEATPIIIRTLSGTVFEDVNYGGGAGRTYAAANTSAAASGFVDGAIRRPGATVELYDAGTSQLVQTTQTNASGGYTFGVGSGDYVVRVVNGSVTSARPGSDGSLGVQTYRFDPATGEVVSDVGGATPSGVDSPAQTLGTELSAITAQSVTPVTVSGANQSGVDFGFNFDTIVNTNNTGQGSLAQFITNSNLLTNTSLAQQGLTADTEHSLFMIPTSDPNFDAGRGVAQIALTDALPAITDVNTAVDGATQTANIGDSNPGQLGAGGAVGLGADARFGTGDETALPFVNRPEIELIDANDLALGLDLQANSAAVRGLALYGFGNAANSDNDANIRVGADAANVLIEANILGTSASSFTDLGANTRSGGDLIRSVGGDNGTLQNNLIGFSEGKGIGLEFGSNGWLVASNEVRGNGIGSPTLDGLDMESGSANTTVQFNLFADNVGVGVDGYASGGNHTVTENTISGNGFGGGETAGVRLFGNGTTVALNRITGNNGAGVLVVGEAAGVDGTPALQNLISQNNFAANGSVAIDLSAAGGSLATGDGQTPNDGVGLDCGYVNSSGNRGVDYPVISSAEVGANDQIVVVGTACADGTNTMTVELYRAAPDPTGHGEGDLFLGSSEVGSNGTPGAWVLTVPSSELAVGEQVTAILLHQDNTTSEFSENLEVGGEEVLDFGDAPNSYGDAGHVIPATPELYLGATAPDAEVATQASAGADGDDSTANGGSDDEDGVTSFNSLSDESTSYTVSVEVNNPNDQNMTLAAWIDFDGNGVFDADEAALKTGVLSGSQALGWENIPTDITDGETYVRVRVSSNPLTASDAATQVTDGEVEDYPLTILDGSQYVCSTAKADLWFANDESGSVDAAEFNDALDFLYQISDGFVYDDVSGVKAGVTAWADLVDSVEVVMPITETFGDPGDSGLISSGSVTTDGDGRGLRELYSGRQNTSQGTRLDYATNYLADLIEAGNGRRENTPQVAVILTDARNDQIIEAGRGGGGAWITEAERLRNTGPDGTSILVIVTEEAAASYSAGGEAKTTIDAVAGANGLVVVAPTYAEAADATNGYIDQVVDSICDLAVAPTPEPADLSLTKSADNTTPAVGERVIFTLTLRNDGPSDATGVEVTDLLPEGLALTSASPSISYTPETGVWDVGTLASGSSAELTFDTTVEADAPAQIINTAEITAADQQDPNSTPNNRSDEPDEDDTDSATLNVYRLSPSEGDIIINEVLFDQSSSSISAANNDEFIELYNAGNAPVDLSGWQLIDANLITDDENGFDGPNGNINGTLPYTFPNAQLAPGEYAIIWIGERTIERDAPSAGFQAWLGSSARLSNTGDDVWLYDAETRIVDYMAYGTNTGGKNPINPPPPASLNLWDDTYNPDLDNTAKGQSISLTPNGVDSNTSACWEPTTSGDAETRNSPNCPGYLPTTDSDARTIDGTPLVTSVAQNNNAFEQRITGTLFYDDGSTGGVANNALQEVGEQGVSNVVITATDGANTVSTTTDGAGNYTLTIPDTFGNTITLSHTQQPATGYNDGTDAVLATTYADADAANVSFTFTDNATYNFGVVRPSTLRPDQDGQVSPGGTISYTHLFTPGTLGTVNLDVAGTYTYQVFRDVDCDGIVQTNEQVDILSSGFTVDDTWPRARDGSLAPCTLELRVFVPQGEPSGRIDLATLSAELAYANNAGVTETQTVIDTTTVTAGGRLELTKQVANVTQNPTDFSSVGEGEPGDMLEYCISYQNLGTEPLTQTRFSDPVPFFTTFQTDAYGAGQDIEWTDDGTITYLSAPLDGDAGELSNGVVQVNIGEIDAGERGQVCYRVQIK